MTAAVNNLLMKIITWNCNMAFRNKAHLISAYQPDILIVPECENPERLKYKDPAHKPAHAAWFGENPHKGIGVFSYTAFTFKILALHNKRFKLVIPILASNGISNLILFAVWANNPKDKDGQYVTQVWKAIQYYSALLKNEYVVLAGDFNSNSIWDRPRRAGNHTDVVLKLAERNIHSVYHKHFKLTHGKEQHPTHYLYRHRDKPYHLDYCFVSSNLLKRLKSVEVGDHPVWSKYSDHMPVIATFSKGRLKSKRAIRVPGS